MELIEEKLVGVLGRVGLPAGIRKEFKMDEGHKVGIYVDRGTQTVVIRSHEDLVQCSVCKDEMKREDVHGSIRVCENCRKQISD